MADGIRKPRLERIDWQRGGSRRFVDVEHGATVGAQVGRDLYDNDGSLIEDLAAFIGQNIVAADVRALNGVPVEKIITPTGTLIVQEIAAESIKAGNLDENVALAGGRISATAGGDTLVLGAGFGSAADLAIWFGATPADFDAALTKANGIFWIDTGGNAYFGGDLLEAKVNQKLEGNSRGANLLPNPTFQNNLSACPTGAAVTGVGTLAVDGWIQTRDESATWTAAQASVSYAPTVGIRCTVNAPVAVPNGTIVAPQVRTRNKILVEEGATYWFGFTRTSAWNGSATGGVVYKSRIAVQWFNLAGAQISSAELNLPRDTSTIVFGDLTAPAGARSAYVYLDTFVQNSSGAAWTHGSTVALRTDFLSAWMIRKVNLDDHIDDGTNYGRLSNTDLFASGGFNRLGLRVAGSGHRVGDQRNLPQSNTAAYGSIRTATALTATSAGAVSVNAHTLRYGAVNVAYSAVANAVTGLTVGTTYVIYCIDAAYAGGVRTWLATTSQEVAMNQGDGIVVAGQVTIPSSGSSSGGGGGAATACVDWDTVLPDGRLVRDLRLGELAECVDVRTGERGMFPLLGIGQGEEPCVRVVTDSGSVIQSECTPVDLPSGDRVRTWDLLGLPLHVRAVDGFEAVRRLEPAGIRRVVKPDFGDRVFYAGERAEATLATHNAMYKP